MELKILGSARYLPHHIVKSTDVDERLGLERGTTERKTGVKVRHHSRGESLADMAKAAAESALQAAGMRARDLDLIISAGASPIQLIPCNAVFYQKALGLGSSGIPAFDLDATCLSFLTALDVGSALINTKRYRRILVISSELASPGLNWKDAESAGLFGDAATAFVFGGPDDHTPASEILGSVMETYGEMSELCRLVGGGSTLPGYKFNGDNYEEYLFHMDGRKLFRQAAHLLPPCLDRLLSKCQVDLDDIKLVIPHQASLSAMTLIRRRLGIDAERWMEIISTHGNCIAASIPTGLHLAISEGRIKRGDLVLLLGTGAGLAVGATLVRY